MNDAPRAPSRYLTDKQKQWRKMHPKEKTLLSEFPELAAQWNYEKNEGLTPEDVAPHSGKKVWWKCKEGHEWQATVNNRANGRGCPYCAGKQVLRGYNDLATKAPDLASEWHPSKNGALTPEDVTLYANKKVWWQCEKGHEWQAKVNNRANGTGCPYCSGQRVLVGYNDLETKAPELAAQWNYEKNGKLTPRDVTLHSGQKVWWKCLKCGCEWKAAVSDRVIGTQCPVCSGKTVLPEANSLQALRPELAAEWHPTLNGDLTPDQVTIGSKKKVWWKCKEGHEWQASICNRKKGSGCPYCAGERVIPGETDLATLYPDIAAEWHPTKNGALTPDQVKPGAKQKVWWRCAKGHEWEAAVYSRSNGVGCPYCKGKKVMPGETDLATTHPDLSAEWHPTKNGSLTPQDVSAGSHKLVWWQCEQRHAWKASVKDRVRGNGCPYCAGQRAIPGETDLQTLCPEVAKKWNMTKNAPLTPDKVSRYSNQKVWWQCPVCGHEWIGQINKQSTSYCPHCEGWEQRPV